MNSVVTERIARIRARMDKEKLDVLMVTIAENRRYLSGYTAEDGQFDETAGALFISPERLLLATDSRYDLQAEKEAPGFEVFVYPKGLFKSLKDILGPLNPSRLGFESQRVSVDQHQQLNEALEKAGLVIETVPTKDLVEDLRIAKDDDEIARTRRALALAEAVFTEVVAILQPGMTEAQVAWEMEKRMREAGAEELAFPVIVAAGPNSALPHAVPGKRKIALGEPLLFDWGARVEGYCSDTSRTVVLGSADETFEKVYHTVLEAQQKAIAAIRAGVATKDVDAVARKHIEAAGFGKNFGHGLGHGTGLAIHEQPRLSPMGDKSLAPGMICTVEPGIYLPDWGGVRLENQVVVTEDGCEVITSLGLDDYVVG